MCGKVRFESRAVKIGLRGDDCVWKTEGIKTGETVVVTANVLIDAESNLEDASSRFTVDPALAILSAFRSGDASLELAELAKRTGLVKSTIMRLAVSLERAGLLIRLPDASYQLGPETLRLGSTYQSSLDLEHHVMPVLEHLAEATEESASLYVRRGNQRLCLYRVDSPHRLRLHVVAGEMRPMDKGAIARVLRGFREWPARTPTGQPDPPLYTAGVTDPYVAALAMPVFGADCKLVGALALSGPVSRLTAERGLTIGSMLFTAAWSLSRALGCPSSDAEPRRPHAAG